MDRACGLSAHGPDHPSVVLSVDLLGAGGGAEKAGDVSVSLLVCFHRECRVLGVGIAFAFVGSLQIGQRLMYYRSIGCHDDSPCMSIGKHRRVAGMWRRSSCNGSLAALFG